MTMQSRKITHLVQGDCFVSNNPFEIYATVLGSCVAVCMYDPHARVGGMNHFLLPGGDENENGDLRYGVHSMELLINGLLKTGADRTELRAKVFGGSEITAGSPKIGEKNQRFIKTFLLREGIRCLASNLGGACARKIRFEPVSGRVRHMLVPPDLATEEVLRPSEKPSSIELF